MKKVVVTGGAGFIGSHLAEELVKQEYSVTVVDNLFTGKKEHLKEVSAKIEFVEGDIRDINLLKKHFAEADTVFHQAALRSVPASVAEPVPYYDVNIIGTHNVLEAARLSGVKRVVFASSSSVYGDLIELPQKEDKTGNRLSPYAISKKTGEDLCTYFNKTYGLETVSLRFFYVFGPRQDPKSQYSAVIPLFITALMNNQQPKIFGDGEQTRDFTHVTN
ncbi:SDR family NAD(P)-dependent oxidoreductase, partial [Candidatus Woesearchaeota archaeon]|nr:SDR family NAD(P)-dependent oxidoreductase [Candidatus Woesearchaeota archaeon]